MRPKSSREMAVAALPFVVDSLPAAAARWPWGAWRGRPVAPRLAVGRIGLGSVYAVLHSARQRLVPQRLGGGRDPLLRRGPRRVDVVQLRRRRRHRPGAAGRTRPRRRAHGALRVRGRGGDLLPSLHAGTAVAGCAGESRHRHVEPPAGRRRTAGPRHSRRSARGRTAAAARPLHQRHPASLPRRRGDRRRRLPQSRAGGSAGRLRGVLPRAGADAARRLRRRGRVAAEERGAGPVSAQRLLGRLASAAPPRAQRRSGRVARRLPALRRQSRGALGRLLLCADGAEGIGAGERVGTSRRQGSAGRALVRSAD